MGSFRFACPLCRTPLAAAAPDELRCPADGMSYRCLNGIWRFLLPDRAGYFRQFLQEYETVRRAERWGSDDPAHYRALPFEDLTGRFRAIWRIRAVSFHALVRRVLRPLEAQRGRPLKILDLGAGNGWLAYRLSQRGHHLAAVDLSLDPFDGLEAHHWYREDSRFNGDGGFLSIQAEVDRLPFAAEQADLAIFNGSLHYSTSYTTTLIETLRVLRSDGVLVIMDSPVYRRACSGDEMVRERREQFERAYGFPSDAIPNENYLTYNRLEELAAALGLHWRIIAPFYGFRWALRPLKARLRGARAPARFLLMVGRRNEAEQGALVPDAAVRRLARWFRLWRFRLFQRHRHNRLVLEEVGGRPLIVLPHVFNPTLFGTSELLAECLGRGTIAPGSRVLDLGTGSGIGAIAAARWAGYVVAVDINPAAVRCARINALLNEVEDRVDVRHGDLFAPVMGERFDVVLFNPPYFRGTPRDGLDQAFRATDVVERYAAGLQDHLSPGGHALVVLSSDAETASFLAVFRNNGFVAEVAGERNLIGERLTVYRLRTET